MPPLEVVVWIVHDDHALDNGAAEVEDGGQISLPCAHDLPAWEVLSVHHWERGFDTERQTLTSDPRNKVAVLWRRKFECPMILSTGGWKTTGKLGKRCHHGGIASPAEEETIDEAGRATVLESDVEDGKQAFPSHLWRWSASACLWAATPELTMMVHEKPIMAHKPNRL